jgi:REP element-mobilizing transposase RayT
MYHFTLVVAERVPLFGKLVESGKPEEANIELTNYGEQVLRLMRDIPDYYSQKGYALKILASQVMPDHIHLLLQATDPLPQKIGEVIRGFKSACTALYKQKYVSCRNDATEGKDVFLFSRIFTRTGTIWEPDIAHYHERIIHSYDQLVRTIRYIKDNPRRLAMKRANPELFRIQEEIEYNGMRMRAMGNRFLLDYPDKAIIQCSRDMTIEEIKERKEAYTAAAENGTVFISAAISEGEKQICRCLRESGYPLVVLLTEGFPKEDHPHYKYYKPSGDYYEACAEGRLLLIEPDAEILERPQIVEKTAAKVGDIPHSAKRWRFVAMNFMAEQFAQ